MHFGEHHAQPNVPSTNRSDSYPLSSVHLIQKWISVTWPNLKCFVLSCYGDHFSAFLWVFVHFDAFGCTCSDSYPLSGVHLFQKWITLVTKEKLKTLCCHGIMTTLVNFGAFCCILLDLMHNLMTPP